MQEQVTAVEPNGNKSIDFSVGEPDDAGAPGDSGQPGPPAAKFLHPGGSRPLEGYTIKRGIGHGGFGEIYYAVSDAGKEVALKLIRRNLDIELRGIRHCLNLKHPNLLSLYDIRQDDDGDTWVVMEYVAGACLDNVVVSNPDGLPTQDALAWFHGLAAGVAYLHDRGIVHRDLKPANIFSDEGVVKVGDYGLSKFVSCSRRSGQTESVGTVHYMAPEVANGRYGKEIDIYALGIVLYEMLSGFVPFEGESVGEVLMKHLTAKPDVSMLAEPYRSVVAKALEKDPAKRFSSVAEMLAALPVPDQAPPGAARIPISPNPAGAAAGAGVGAGVAGAAAAGAAGHAGNVHQAVAVDEEPLYKAVRDACNTARGEWDRADFATPIKVIIFVAAVLVLMLTYFIWIPLTAIVVIGYSVYWIIRKLVISQKSTDGGGDTRQAAVARDPERPSRETPGRQRYGAAYARTRPGRKRRKFRRERAAEALVTKPAKERLIELLGAMLGGSLVAIAMSVVMLLLYDYSHGGQALNREQFLWLVCVSIAGAWSVMIPAKFWEGTRGEATLRRFIMMVVGLGMGVFAYAVSDLLMVVVPTVSGATPHGFAFSTPTGFYATDGQPAVMAYVACFGTMFLLARWWLLADPLRSTRLSLWATMLCVAAAWLVSYMWGFTHEWWIPMVAATIAVSVQLGSPWLSPRERARRQAA